MSEPRAPLPFKPLTHDAPRHDDPRAKYGPGVPCFKVAENAHLEEAEEANEAGVVFLTAKNPRSRQNIYRLAHPLEFPAETKYEESREPEGPHLDPALEQALHELRAEVENLKLEYANFADRLKTLERLNLAEELSILHQEIGTLALENRKIKSQMAEMAKSLGLAQEARETTGEDEDDLALDSEIFDIEHPLA